MEQPDDHSGDQSSVSPGVRSASALATLYTARRVCDSPGTGFVLTLLQGVQTAASHSSGSEMQGEHNGRRNGCDSEPANQSGGRCLTTVTGLIVEGAQHNCRSGDGQ